MTRKEIKDKYGIGAGTIWRYGFRLAIKIYDKYNRKCKECSSENDLIIHHLDNQGRNYENKGLKPNNKEDNLVLLCRSCHGKIHGSHGGGHHIVTEKSLKNLAPFSGIGNYGFKIGGVPWNKGKKIGSHSEEHKRKIGLSVKRHWERK